MGLVTADKLRALTARVATLEPPPRGGSRGEVAAAQARNFPARKTVRLELDARRRRPPPRPRQASQEARPAKKAPIAQSGCEGEERQLQSPAKKSAVGSEEGISQEGDFICTSEPACTLPGIHRFPS